MACDTLILVTLVQPCYRLTVFILVFGEGSSEVDRCNQLIQQEFTRFKAQISTQAATSKPSTSNANPKGSSSASTDSTGLMARLASLNKKKPSAQELQSFLTADLVFKAYGITDWQLPLRWWKAHSTLYPTIALMARSYLAASAGSCAVERLFSAASDVCSNSWGRLLPTTIGNHPDQNRRPGETKALTALTKLTDCPFTATGYFHKKKQARFFTCKETRHNHPPSEYAAAHTANQKLTPALFIEMENLGNAGLKPQGILAAMKKAHPNKKILATISTLHTARKKSRLQSLQGLSPIAHLNKTLLNTDFTTTTKVNDQGVLKALFFCHTRSVKLLTAYPHIILLDCMYNTNKYSMLLLHISGITGANKTFSIAFCFMAEETKSFYDWALQALVTAFGSHKIPFPAVVITHRKKALINSLATTFPGAKRMLCTWHIQKNLLAKASKLIDNPEQEKDMLNYWSNMTWLPVAEHYANAWTNNIAHFNNSTTSRMESEHAFIKSHLLGPQHGFTLVIKLISNALESQYHEITSKKVYNNLVKVKKAKKLGHCNQHYRARMGIPCKHRMAAILGSGEPIGPDEFHEQWHQKSIRTVLRTNSKEMIAKIKEMKDKLVGLNPAQMAIQLAAINRIIEGTGTVINIKLPTEAQKTCGRPGGSKNKPKTTKRGESEFEHVEKGRKNEEKQAGKFKKQKMAEDKKQAAPKKTNTLKKRKKTKKKPQSTSSEEEESTSEEEESTSEEEESTSEEEESTSEEEESTSEEEESTSEEEESTSEEEESTSEEEKPATKKKSQPKKTANTRRPNLKTTKEEKKPAPAPKKKPAPIKTTPAPIKTTPGPVKTASLPSPKKITPIRTATLCPRPPTTPQPPQHLNLKKTLHTSLFYQQASRRFSMLNLTVTLDFKPFLGVWDVVRVITWGYFAKALWSQKLDVYANLR
ncbi:hypothetical protein MJO28_009389 [Puccinia striiformis f. sp. tritici]|uniref:Uncharacterized protein n=1 Tax=Puccinia striiformis f. sp. tritici TaxID=168172 RepID=A0ACC0E7G9_9BASI|nr:hypothetical protein MJO28_009389 [Puccinia striiformis f. sp. tritici]